jgi:tetratricopeptide (TPR) repeat protein
MVSAEIPPQRLYPVATLRLDLRAQETQPTGELTQPHSVRPIETIQPDSTAPPGLDPVPKPVTETVISAMPKSTLDLMPSTAGSQSNKPSGEDAMTALQKKLETARYFRTTRQTRLAEPLLIELLAEDSPETIRQSALLEMAAAAQDENELPRAQQIYAQFLNKWQNDLRVPEILLRQGLLFRQMGLNNLALTKFYAVMTSALVLKNDQLDYYGRLVQKAQTEIADTHYTLGKYTDAAEFFSRLMKQTNSNNKSTIQYKLTRCHSELGLHAETISSAQDFLTRFGTAPEQPEIRFYLAQALKHVGRDNESLQQVLTLLKEQKEQTKDRPAVWAYWQQRAGNLIGNHLYREGDYAKALEVYLSLAQLDDSPAWRLQVQYQIAMTYERLWQPIKAAKLYGDIVKLESELANNASPSLKTVFEMSRWRMNFIDWQNKAEEANRRLNLSSETNAPVTASLPALSLSIP